MPKHNVLLGHGRRRKPRRRTLHLCLRACGGRSCPTHSRRDHRPAAHGARWLEPPGIQDGGNFAQPVNSNGFVGPAVPFTGPAGPGLLITFNYGVAPAKVVGTGVFVVVGQTPAGPLYIELVTPDSSFPAFRHCPRFSTG